VEKQQTSAGGEIYEATLAQRFTGFFGKLLGLLWILSHIPLIFGASVSGEIGRNLSGVVGYISAEVIFFLISLFFSFIMFRLYKKRPTSFGKFLVTFCAIVSVYIILGTIGHLLSGNQILFTSSFS